MKVLVINHLFPPHHAGTYDFRCEAVVAALRARGHEVKVLTSNHGLRAEQRAADIERRLLLNGVFGHERLDHVMDLKDIEFHNNRVVGEVVGAFWPNVIYVWSLLGVSKSILLTLARRGLPIAFDVSDRWLAEEFRNDPWLSFWNREQLPFKDKAVRASLELSGQRDRWDEQAPTRAVEGVKRLPQIFGGTAAAAPGVVDVLPLRHVSFVCDALKRASVQAGFPVQHAQVIPPALSMAAGASSGSRTRSGVQRLLCYLPLVPGSGAMTALRALQSVIEQAPDTTLTIAGQGDGEYIAKLRSHALQHELPVEFDILKDTQAEMSAIFARHDLLLHTVETDDLFTMVPMEAMAAGLPVVVTTCGTAGEFFRHGENCLLFAPGDFADLAVRIRELQGREDLRSYLSTQGMEQARRQFSPQAVLDQTEAFLQSAVTGQ